jgi:hypothetical protein
MASTSESSAKDEVDKERVIQETGIETVTWLLGFLTETNAFFKTTPRRIPEHPDTSDPPGAG